MSVSNVYEREEWERQGGWRGVEPYVNFVTLLFCDDDEIDEIDDLEESSDTRTEIPLEERNAVLVTVTRHRAYRCYERLGDREWLLYEQGERDFTDSIVVAKGQDYHRVKLQPGVWASDGEGRDATQTREGE